MHSQARPVTPSEQELPIPAKPASLAASPCVPRGSPPEPGAEGEVPLLEPHAIFTTCVVERSGDEDAPID